jgi:hypothetical protein
MAMAPRIGVLALLLVLSGCDLPQYRLVCTRDGKVVYRSAAATDVWQRDRSDTWVIGGDRYLPEPGTTCRAVEL